MKREVPSPLKLNYFLLHSNPFYHTYNDDLAVDISISYTFPVNEN